jgi:hypothetical protein
MMVEVTLDGWMFFGGCAAFIAFVLGLIVGRAGG